MDFWIIYNYNFIPLLTFINFPNSLLIF